VLDTVLFELRRDGDVVSVEPQTFDVLTYLVAHRDRVVSKQELMDAVWGNRFVTESAVTSRIKQARRALGDDGRAQQQIGTVHGRGYRFVGEVSTDDADSARETGTARSDPTLERAPIRYTVSDGLHIAYQVTGGGETDVVLISGFVSHLDLDWAHPAHAHFLDRLGQMGRLIRFDKRGTGMSDRPEGLPDLETRMHDVLAVMDTVGSERAVLCGYSEGGPMAILMAATHPERVSALVLYGSYARRTRAPDYPWAQTEEERSVYTDLIVDTWDWEADLRMRCPSGDAGMQRWWAQRMRASATPTTIRALMAMNSLVDVREVLSAIHVPTLVLHRTGDSMFHTEEARYLADRIPGARLQLLEGSDHFVAGNPDQILDHVEPFLESLPPPRLQSLTLAAVVAIAGPAQERLIEHLVAAGGRRRSSRSGTEVVLFDGPATAVRAALGTLDRHMGIGVDIAEVPRHSDAVAGPGVGNAEQLAAQAPAGEVLVSMAAAVLLASSGVRLQPPSPDADPDGLGSLRVVR
jgi:pimeloyl-ACP methyl ester carboxylesterase